MYISHIILKENTILDQESNISGENRVGAFVIDQSCWVSMDTLSHYFTNISDGRLESQIPTFLEKSECLKEGWFTETN